MNVEGRVESVVPSRVGFEAVDAGAKRYRNIDLTRPRVSYGGRDPIIAAGVLYIQTTSYGDTGGGLLNNK